MSQSINPSDQRSSSKGSNSGSVSTPKPSQIVPKKPSTIVDTPVKKETVTHHVPQAVQERDDIGDGRHIGFSILTGVLLFLGFSSVLVAFIFQMVFGHSINERYEKLFFSHSPDEPLVVEMKIYISLSSIALAVAIVLPAVKPSLGKGKWGLILYVLYLVSSTFTFLFVMWRRSKAEYLANGHHIILLTFCCGLSSSFGFLVAAFFSKKKLFYEIGIPVAIVVQITFMVLLNKVAEVASRTFLEYLLYLILTGAWSYYFLADLEIFITKRFREFKPTDATLSFFMLQSDIIFRFWVYLFVKKEEPTLKSELVVVSKNSVA